MYMKNTRYLVSAGAAESVEDGYEPVGRRGHHEQVAQANVPIHGRIVVHFRWRPQ